MALVIPAFEVKVSTNMTDPLSAFPTTRSQLLQLYARNEAQQVHLFKGKRAHNATNYEKWYRLESEQVQLQPYRVEYEYLYEPYVLLSKNSSPLYDTRFSGYGNDKSSYTYELVAAGFSFVVLPDVFIIHNEHGPPLWFWKSVTLSTWRKWSTFVLDIQRKYDFFLPIPQSLKDDCKAGSCPAFWHWLQKT